MLGHPFFPAPGILSEKIFITHVDVTGLVPEAPQGDGTPMEEGGELRWRDAASFAAALRDGTIQDAKTELAFARFTTRGA